MNAGTPGRSAPGTAGTGMRGIPRMDRAMIVPYRLAHIQTADDFATWEEPFRALTMRCRFDYPCTGFRTAFGFH